MRFGKLGMAAIAAVSLVGTPVLAQAGKTEAVRVDATAKKKKNDAEGSTGIIIGVVAAAAIIGGIVILADGSDDAPTSP